MLDDLVRVYFVRSAFNTFNHFDWYLLVQDIVTYRVVSWRNLLLLLLTFHCQRVDPYYTLFTHIFISYIILPQFIIFVKVFDAVSVLEWGLHIFWRHWSEFFYVSLISFKSFPIVLNYLHLDRLISQNYILLSITRATWYLLNFKKLVNLVLSGLYLHFVRILLSFLQIALKVLFIAGKLLELLIRGLLDLDYWGSTRARDKVSVV